MTSNPTRLSDLELFSFGHNWSREGEAKGRPETVPERNRATGRRTSGPDRLRRRRGEVSGPSDRRAVPTRVQSPTHPFPPVRGLSECRSTRLLSTSVPWRHVSLPPHTPGRVRTRWGYVAWSSGSEISSQSESHGLHARGGSQGSDPDPDRLGHTPRSRGLVPRWPTCSQRPPGMGRLSRPNPVSGTWVRHKNLWTSLKLR